MITNGILLTGGQGKRLLPFTKFVSKHLLNLNSKPIIDYPLATLQSLGCKEVCVVVGGDHHEQLLAYLQDGSQYGMNFNYIYQREPKGIAQAINLCRRQVQDQEHFTVALGDNYFEEPITFNNPYPGTAQIVLARHKELQRFGVASIRNGTIASIVEKPAVLDCTAENYAVAGCYLFDQHYFDYFRNIKPSARGEFEISEVIEQYRQDHALDHVFAKGNWSDLGTHQSLLEVQQHLIKKTENAWASAYCEAHSSD